MEGYMTQDRIDIELSKAYFNNHPDKKKRKSTPPVKNKKNPKNTKKTVAIILAFLAGVILATSYFLNTKTFELIKNKLDRKESPAINSLTDTPNNAPAPATSATTINKPVEVPSYAKKKPKNAYPQYNISSEQLLYNFETTEEGWEIPQWEYDKPDHFPVSIERTTNFAKNGNGSLEFNVNFPGGKWNGALIEVEQYLDFEEYDLLSVDIFLPENAPWGLRGKLILTSGENWQFIEMIRGTRLYPGEWNTVYADIRENSYRDWKKQTIDKDIKMDVRKIAIRIESEKSPYTGPVYIDNVKASILEK